MKYTLINNIENTWLAFFGTAAHISIIGHIAVSYF